MSERPLSERDPEPVELSDSPFTLTGTGQENDDHDEPDTGRRRGVRRVLLGSLLALGLAGTVVLGTTVWRITSQKDATVTAPPEVAGLRLDDGQQATDTADFLKTALSAEVDLDEAVAGVYLDPAGADRSVLFFGGTTLIWTPEADLDTAFELIADDQGAVTGVEDVPAGSLGGTMKCGTTATGDGDMAVCGWADHGSLALAMFPNRGASDAAALLVKFRTAAQTRE